MTRLAVCLALLSVLALGRPAAARDILALSGGDATTRGDVYGYIGAVIPLNESGKLGEEGWLLRLWGAGQAIQYTRQGTTNVDAVGGIGEIAIGRTLVARGNTWLNAYLGYIFQAFDTSPNDPLTTLDRNHGLKVQAEFNTDIGNDWGIELMGSYTVFLNQYWTRIRPYIRVTDTISIGPELSPFGGKEWDNIRFGGFVEGIPIGKALVGLKAGGERDVRRKKLNAYFGASVTIVF